MMERCNSSCRRSGTCSQVMSFARLVHKPNIYAYCETKHLISSSTHNVSTISLHTFKNCILLAWQTRIIPPFFSTRIPNSRMLPDSTVSSRQSREIDHPMSMVTILTSCRSIWIPPYASVDRLGTLSTRLTLRRSTSDTRII